jgi:hypothetical protein
VKVEIAEALSTLVVAHRSLKSNATRSRELKRKELTTAAIGRGFESLRQLQFPEDIAVTYFVTGNV